MTAPAKTIALADGIVAVLNEAAATMEYEFQATRAVRVMTLAELQELKELRVSVFTGSVKRERGGRWGFDGTYKPVVAIQRKFDGRTPEENQAIEAKLERLEEQIIEALADPVIAGLAMLEVNESADTEVYSAEAAAQANVFASAISLTYREGE